MSFIQSLLENHPIRKTKAQKAAFRQWFAEEARKLGYETMEEKASFSCNVIAGDPETAAVTYTAHYDTPPVMPVPNFITPKNVLVYLLYQMLIVLLFIIVTMGVGILAGWLTKEPAIGALAAMVAYFVLFGMLMFGPANKNCANDNTSGVAAVMEIMSRIPEEARGKAAFILFDNEEKGLLGSSGYASKHKEVRKNKLIINLDCVGDGEHMLFIAKKKIRKQPEWALLEQVMGAQQGRVLHMENEESCVYPSDQANFKRGIAVCACNKMKVIGYYVDKIHTKKDTVCDQENMDYLGEGLSRFAVELEA